MLWAAAAPAWEAVRVVCARTGDAPKTDRIAAAQHAVTAARGRKSFWLHIFVVLQRDSVQRIEQKQCPGCPALRDRRMAPRAGSTDPMAILPFDAGKRRFGPVSPLWRASGRRSLSR